MKLRHLLPCLALFSAPTLFAQGESIITTEPVAIPEAAPDPNEPHAVVEEMPEFSGGDGELFKYIVTEVKYPTKAKEQGIKGIVYVTFVIDTVGGVKDLKLLRGIGGGCDEEALRVVQNMPNWVPGKQNGKPVRVQYNLPVRFHP